MPFVLDTFFDMNLSAAALQPCRNGYDSLPGRRRESGRESRDNSVSTWRGEPTTQFFDLSSTSMGLYLFGAMVKH